MKTRFTLRLAAGPFVRSLDRIGRWFSNHVIQNVPEEMSFCEYECQDTDCHIAKWALCEKRAARPRQVMVRID